jgi:AraC family transcriptional regulator of adaptative response / DNA-3-methyladenine glycosylase II
MQQQHKIYERARLARDPRFDGQFYVGVITTGIYCRPICPANSPKSENIQFYPSAAAAGEAGFRPCLRCRPECAPGSPAWSGTSTTVRRGLRLIANGALDDGGVESLADRLGVTSRHLRRLFTHHIGASPLAVAHTQRLHFAKRLIDETTLPLNHIVVAAGFGSTRRFNDTFKNTYGRAPRELRKIGGRNDDYRPEATLTVRLPYRQPFAWSALLDFFKHRVTPGVETVDGDCYRRTLLVDNKHAVVELRPTDKGNYLSLTMHGVGTSSIFETVQKARDVFDLDAPVAEIGTVLSADPVLKPILKLHPGIRVPGSWDGFELTIRAILGQQISVKAATTLAGRIAIRYGNRLDHVSSNENNLSYLFPTAERLSRARFNNIGLVGSRAATLRRVATACVRGELQFDTAQDPQEFCTTLKSIKGIGDWTAQYVAMRALKNPDAFPASDLGLIKALKYPDKVTPMELSNHAESWRPWRAYAALLLWNSLADSGG